jgi:GNAT acetyltransferase-like protein
MARNSADQVPRMSVPPTSSAFSVLDAGDPADLAVWIERWNRWPDREIMAHPEFVRRFARNGDRVVAASALTARGGILYPFILRPLAAEPWAADQAGWDATTPYGYGGPYAWNAMPDDAAFFWARFSRWARARDVITSFARLSLFPDQLLPFDGEVTVNSPNVVRNLELGDDELWQDYAPKVRQNVRRARSRGCVLQVDPDGARLDEFHQVYIATMTRRNAATYYFFPRQFFESMLRGLRGHCGLFHVVHSNRVVSSELVLLSHRHAYFFLGGTLAEAFDLRPNDFLQHETFRWCREAGKKALVLGGGYRGSEGLLRYKKSFAPGGEVPFKVGARVHNPEREGQLLERRRRWEQARGVDWRPDPAFFPPYRAA